MLYTQEARSNWLEECRKADKEIELEYYREYRQKKAARDGNHEAAQKKNL